MNGEVVLSNTVEFKTKAELPAETEVEAMDRIARAFQYS
jgi:hypothetical protein